MSRSDHLGSRPGVPQIWPLLVKNVSGEEVPAFALLRVTAVTDADFTGEIVYSVDKPNSSSLDRLIVNGPMPIPATTNARGRATWIFPTFCAFKSSDGTPAAGDNWGPVSGSWELRKVGSGFTVLGGATSDGVVLAKWIAGGYVIVRGNPTGPVDATDTTFYIDGLEALTQGAPKPIEPLQVVNRHAEYFETTDIVYAIYLKDAGGVDSGIDWETIPGEKHQVKVKSTDRPNFLENQFHDWSMTPYDGGSHTLVKFATEDTGTDGTPQLRAYIEGTGGGGSYTAGCGITIDSSEISVDPVSLTDPCDDTSLAPVDLVDPLTNCQIKVLIGCGIKRVDTLACGNACEDGGPGSLMVDRDAVAGKGLIKDSDSAEDPCACDIQVDLGCGLEFGSGMDANKVQVKVDPDGCLSCSTSGLAVNAGDCLECDSGTLNVKVDPSGCVVCGENGLDVDLIGATGIDITGCTISALLADPLYINMSGYIDLKIDPSGCLTNGMDGLKLTSLLLKDVTCDLSIVAGNLKLTLTKTYCDDSTDDEECTIPLFECEE